MKILRTAMFLSLCLLFFGVLVSSGCSSQFAASLRKVTYPPDFNYIEPTELRSEMAKLAQQMRLLDQALNQKDGQSPNAVNTQRQQVLGALHNIDRIASKLNAGDSGSSHPFMQNFMRDFVSRVGEARVAASLEQPRYYYAGKVSGGCVNCHKVNR